MASALPATSYQDSSAIGTDATQIGGDWLSYNITGAEYDESIFFKKALVNVGDGEISSLWEDVNLVDAAPFGENGKLGSVWGQEHIYFYMRQDANIEWISFQWDTDLSTDPENFDDSEMSPMALGDDMWLLGTSSIGSYGDGYTVSQSPLDPIGVDIQRDLVWDRVLVNDTDGNPLYVEWEMTRELYTNDTEGADIEFTTISNSSLLIASDVFHRPDTAIMNFKFSLTSLRVGGEAPSPLTVDPGSTVDVDSIFTSYIIKGVLYAILAGVVLFASTILIMKKETK